jgi:hypothetical protein
VIDVDDENRGRAPQRREKRQREQLEGQRSEGAKDDNSYHEHLRSGDYRRCLSRGGDAVDAEVGQTGQTDEASALAAGQFDKQVWQQLALETVQEAQQALWALILRLKRRDNTAAEKEFLSSLLALTLISVDDENTLSTIDGSIRSSEKNFRFPDLTNELRSLRSKVENYRLVTEIVEKEHD